MAVFVSKFALTRGIVEHQGQLYPSGGFSYLPAGKGPGWTVYVGARHAHETREAAVAAAEKLRLAKIATLEKELARLRALDFSVPA